MTFDFQSRQHLGMVYDSGWIRWWWSWGLSWRDSLPNFFHLCPSDLLVECGRCGKPWCSHHPLSWWILTQGRTCRYRLRNVFKMDEFKHKVFEIQKLVSLWLLATPSLEAWLSKYEFCVSPQNKFQEPLVLMLAAYFSPQILFHPKGLQSWMLLEWQWYCAAKN